MPITYTKPVTGAQLVTGIIGTVDIGNTIAKSIEITIETKNIDDLLKRIQDYSNPVGHAMIKNWVTWAKSDYSDIASTVETWLGDASKFSASLVRNQVGLSMLGYQASASMMGLLNKFYCSITGIDTLTDCVYGIPQSVVMTRAERYWNKVLSPNIPDVKTAFQMLMEGDLSRSEFNEFCSMEGWGSKWHDKLYNMLDREPDEYTAFSMFKRGIISSSEMIRCFKTRGYDEKWHKPLYEYLHRIPSAYDLMRMADYTPLEPLWVAEMLRKNGFDDATVLRMVSVIQKRPLREEVRNVAGRYAWQYQVGRLSLDKLKENLEKLELLPNEIALWVLWSELRYADELIDEQIEILKLKCQKGAITDKETIITELKRLGIREEKANLMAEDWYWRYLVN